MRDQYGIDSIDSNFTDSIDSTQSIALNVSGLDLHSPEIVLILNATLAPLDHAIITIELLCDVDRRCISIVKLFSAYYRHD